jgi:hypothetical protein
LEEDYQHGLVYITIICNSHNLCNSTPGIFLLRKIKTAVIERADQDDNHKQLTGTIPPAAIDEWTLAITQWEEDPVNNPNPFVRKEKG